MRTTTAQKRKPGAPALFTRRVVLLEEPAVVARAERLARGSGCSVAAVIRGALRWYLNTAEGE